MAFSTIQGSGGAPDSFVGTSGVDSIVFEGNTSNFFLGAQQANDFIGFDNVQFLETGTYTNGTLRGGAGIDNFIDLTPGGQGVNLVSSWINGNGDDDIFDANNNLGLQLISSTLQGGQGDDTMFVNGASNSLFNGNRDDDDVNFTGVVSSSTIGGGQGDDDIDQFGGTLTGSSILLGNGDDDFDAFGAIGADNTIEGGDGNDDINIATAAAADDTVIDGGAGTDVIQSGAGDDTLLGGAGNDAITGNFGADTMTGGTGANAFIYGAVPAPLVAVDACGDVATGEVDVITDFTTGTDSLDVVFDITSGGNATVAGANDTTYANALATANFVIGAANQFALVAVSNATGTAFTSYLFGDTTGAGVDFAIQIGETNAYATAIQATSTVAIGDIV